MNYIVMTTLLMKQHIRKRFKPAAEKKEKNNNGKTSKVLSLDFSLGKEYLLLLPVLFLFLGGFIISQRIGSGVVYPRFQDLVLPPEAENGSLILNTLFPSLSDNFVGDDSAAVSYPLVSFDPVVYTIKRGDALSSIAKQYNVDLGTLISVNSIKDVRKIVPGMELRIPKVNGVLYTVKRGDSLSLIAHRHGVSLNDILDANNLASETIRPGESLFIPGAKISRYDYDLAMGQLFLYPTSGRITSGFGYRLDPFTGHRRFHYGIDIANVSGTPVRAARDGQVLTIGSNSAYGEYLVIRHENGFQTLYAHLDGVHIKKGQWVKQGQLIGDMGNTGRSTGTHLHFSIYKNNNALDPLLYLQ